MSAKVTKKKSKAAGKGSKPSKKTKKVSKKVQKKAVKRAKTDLKAPKVVSRDLVKPDASEFALLDKRHFAVRLPYSEKIASEIVERVFEGERLSSICSKTAGYPRLSDVYKWLRDHSEFREAYELARQTEALRSFEKITELAKEAEYADKDSIPGLKLAVDTHKWISERTDRKAYAQSQPKEDGSGVVINISTGIQRDTGDSRTLEDVVGEIRDVGPEE